MMDFTGAYSDVTWPSATITRIWYCNRKNETELVHLYSPAPMKTMDRGLDDGIDDGVF